jgi:hypothetical protein
MSRKFLFVVFTDDACRQNHAWRWGLNLKKSGYSVRILIEGVATRLFLKLDDPDQKTASLFNQAKEEGLIVGACLTASNGCANQGNDIRIADLVTRHGVQLDGDLDHHAGIEKHIREGFELVVI